MSNCYIIVTLLEFFTPALANGFSVKFEWQQVSLSFLAPLSILADLNNAVGWMVSTCPLISKSSSPCINPLMSVPRGPITLGITITFIFHSLFNSLARFWYLSFFLLSFNLTLYSAGTAKSTIQLVLFLLLLLLLLLFTLCEFSHYYYYYYYYYQFEHTKPGSDDSNCFKILLLKTWVDDYLFFVYIIFLSSNISSKVVLLW